MLNDADGQGGGNAGNAASDPVKDAEALFRKLKRFVKTDYNSKGQVNWRREAREDFDFEAGEQLNEEDKAILQDAKRPIVIFNRVGTTVDSVSGQEVGNRKEVQPSANFDDSLVAGVRKGDVLTRKLDGAIYEMVRVVPNGFGRTRCNCRSANGPRIEPARPLRIAECTGATYLRDERTWRAGAHSPRSSPDVRATRAAYRVRLMSVRAFANYVHDWETPELAAEVQVSSTRSTGHRSTTMVCSHFRKSYIGANILITTPAARSS